jgi:protein-L-isoaspartate(D-aspartate) O-methyltransferase
MSAMAQFAAARRHMVESQLLPNRITDPRLVAAMGAVAREHFVPANLRPVAYVDEDLEIRPGRFLMEPRVFAGLLQAAAIEPGQIVLDIGCATGYSAAVLARLAGTVVALESDPDLFADATRLLTEVGADNVAVVAGPLAKGLAAQGPFDVIVLEGAVERAPLELTQQLTARGALLAVVRDGPIGRATIWRRAGKAVARRVLFDAGTPLLLGFALERGFVF